MLREAIIDNSVIANFLSIQQPDLLQLLRNLFKTIYVPLEVKNEIAAFRSGKPENRRKLFLDRIELKKGFYRACSAYDSILLGLLTPIKEIHPGEREAIAQAMKTQVHLFLTDDKACINFIKDKYDSIQCCNSLFLIALLDLNGSLQDYRSVIKQLNKSHHFRPKDLRDAYINACKLLGISISKKEMSSKTSLKKLLD